MMSIYQWVLSYYEKKAMRSDTLEGRVSCFADASVEKDAGENTGDLKNEQAFNYRKPYPKEAPLPEKEKEEPKKEKPRPVSAEYIGIAATLGVVAFVTCCFLMYYTVQHGDKGAFAVLVMMPLPLLVSVFMLLQAQWRGMKT
jgi:hypothetical protein